jgi:hypothetical protein
VFDIDWPASKLKNLTLVIQRCRADFKEFFKQANLISRFPTGTGEIKLYCVLKDPDNRIVYVIFKVEPDDLPDVCIIYFYDPATDRLVAKMLYSL